jgi:hypothetical protein
LEAMRTIILLLILILYGLNSYATHLMGGEITWKCLPNGQFQFYMKVYRDCNSGFINIDVSNGIQVYNYPTPNSPTFSIPITLISLKDISNGCFSCQNPGGSAGAVEEYLFSSSPITLTGTPPAAGWIFSYDGCCRNAAIDNIQNAGNEGFTLRSKMFAYNGNNTLNCYDASPEFAAKPAVVSCASNLTYLNHFASDKELDSLSYSWAEALDDFFGNWSNSNPPDLSYNPGYSPESPFPGIVQDPGNQPAILNPLTGQVSFYSNTLGNFTAIIKVEAWKCNQKVAEVYREIQVAIVSCTTSEPPAVNPPFHDNLGNYTLYTDTVTVGELVNFTLTGSDNGTVIVSANGSQLGTNDTIATSGCPYPPCATLSSSLPDSGFNAVSTVFNWQTDCNHLAWYNGCSPLYTNYSFAFTFRDDNCPVPGDTTILVNIVVVGDSVVNSPELHCASVLENGDVQLFWTAPDNSVNTFNSYHIFQLQNGLYTVIDSLFDITTTTYIHQGANATNSSQSYLIKTRSGCGGSVYSYETIRLTTIFPEIYQTGIGVINLNWNALSTPLPSSASSGYYHIYRLLPGENWTSVDSTQSLEYSDTVFVCNDSIHYRIELADTTGCVSVSGIASELIEVEEASAEFVVYVDGVMQYIFTNYSENIIDWIWDFGDGTTETSYNAGHTYTDTGEYIVTLIAWNVCDTDTFILPLTVTSINDIETTDNITIYPNPATTQLTIEMNSQYRTSNIECRIMNTIGQDVLHSTLDIRNSIFDISSLAPGLYLLQVFDAKGELVKTEKVVKE